MSDPVQELVRGAEFMPESLWGHSIVSVTPVDIGRANALLVQWRHGLGPCRRPFRVEPWVLQVNGRAVSVAISATTVSSQVRDQHGEIYGRGEVVELARLCSGEKWANRVMLRLWREVLAPAWAPWTPRALVSYSLSRRHAGDLYRFDGWTPWGERPGATGGGSWTRHRQDDHPAYGRKMLWGYLPIHDRKGSDEVRR